MITRRTFILAGVAGSAALAGAWWLYGRYEPAAPAGLRADAAPVMSALIPALLEGALPEPGPRRDEAVRATYDRMRAAVAILPPAAQGELDQLFALLASAAGRWAFAGLTTNWPQADERAAAAVLERWRSSRFALRRSAYDALHQLVYAAWYAAPESWSAIGYPGPPELG